ncbi:UNVERIFIED_CONTAM: Metal tolerance protein C1 [Sesamum radiatum]|uniref:Metal tolerance protein C1 n=1 Tax=Sesamum radiatum TaxID=300843 RepID=A0AAW2W224_SESRA
MITQLLFSENPNFKIHRRWHLGHTHHHDHHEHRDLHSGKEGEKIFRLGLAADIGLAAGKAVTGYLSGSTAIIADAAHSISDVVLSGVALLSFKAAMAPKDKEHPYGHGKFETLGALGISGVLLATAGGIAWHALDVLLKMVVQRITRHSLQGQIFLEIEVTMPPNTLIREAVEVAEEAEKKILEIVPNLTHVSIQLRLGRPMPEVQNEFPDVDEWAAK